MLLAIAALSTRRIRYPKRSSPATCRVVWKSDGSVRVTSRKSTRSPSGMWLAARSSASFSRYSFSSRSSGSFAMTRMAPRAACSTSRCATWSSSTRSTRSSVARVIRDSSEVVTIAAMNNEAIFTPSGRSRMFASVV